MMRAPPLSLYVHTPWCESKCPYCDFNSHAAPRPPPEAQYVRALLADLECDLPYLRGREITSVFIGGGTPSLFGAAAIADLLDGVRERAPLSDTAEITLEANPGSADADKFAGFAKAGVNRLSLGVQSFNDDLLRRLGRVHDGSEAEAAFAAARAAGFDNVNLDLMFALPEQTFEQGVADVERALAFAPEHISYYQLTLEPNTAFYTRPPVLPDPESAWRLETHAQRLLRDAGYIRYEVSAWARAHRQCRHNLNYWRFGDYLGIGSGAHAKLTLADGGIVRFEKHRAPNRYLDAYLDNGDNKEWDFRAWSKRVGEHEVVFEFMLNALRLVDGFDESVFAARAGVSFRTLKPRLAELEERGLLECGDDRVRTTTLGMRFLNEVQSAFLPPASSMPQPAPSPVLAAAYTWPAGIQLKTTRSDNMNKPLTTET